MVLMNSNLKDAAGFTNVPEGWYKMHCIDTESPENDGVSTTEAGGDMWTGHFEIEDGQFSGKNINYHNIMLGGMSKKGKPINTGMPGGLCEFVNAAKVKWECAGCGKTAYGSLVHGSAAEDKGLDKGHFYCPNCFADATMSYDTKDFVGPSVMGYVSARLDLKGRPQDRIERFLAVGDPETTRPVQSDPRRRR